MRRTMNKPVRSAGKSAEGGEGEDGVQNAPNRGDFGASRNSRKGEHDVPSRKLTLVFERGRKSEGATEVFKVHGDRGRRRLDKTRQKRLRAIHRGGN